MVPRGGLPRSCEINEVGFGRTLKTPTRSLGFLPRVSHLGRDVELAKLAVIGGGPVFRKAGRNPVYEPSELDRWAEARVGPPQRSTSEVDPA
jgi:hypothetical protein